MSPTLCPTAQVIASVIDGASERAILIASDGTILHWNGAAKHFLNSTAKTAQEIFAECNDDCVHNWTALEHSRIVMADGKTTRSERNLHWIKTDCPCCDKVYYTAYICSKHERVREVVDNAFDPVITADISGTIITANDAAAELFGYTESELVGHSLSLVCGGGHGPKHDQYMKNYEETGKAKILGKKREAMGRKKDGSEFPCELGIQEIKDVSTGKRFFCGYIKDLTILKQHEADLQEKQALMQGMINASFDSMLEIDQDGIITICNDAACSMFGYSREEFIGSNVSIICGDGHAEKHDAYMQRYLKTGVRHIIGQKRQVKARRKDGSELEVELGVQEVTLSSGKKAFCGFIRDLTQQKKDKRALRKQQQLIHGKFFNGE